MKSTNERSTPQAIANTFPSIDNILQQLWEQDRYIHLKNFTNEM